MIKFKPTANQNKKQWLLKLKPIGEEKIFMQTISSVITFFVSYYTHYCMIMYSMNPKCKHSLPSNIVQSKQIYIYLIIHGSQKFAIKFAVTVNAIKIACHRVKTSFLINLFLILKCQRSINGPVTFLAHQFLS